MNIEKLFLEHGALLKGHFLLSSGLHSDRYLQCALVLAQPGAAETLGRELAAKSEKPDLVLSLHADAAADGVDPYQRDGTRTYYLHSHAEAFARVLQRTITQRMRTEDRGVMARDLALTRPSGSAAILCELATLTIPEYEYLLGQPTYQEAMADALAAGTLAYIRAVQQSTSAASISQRASR